MAPTVTSFGTTEVTFAVDVHVVDANSNVVTNLTLADVPARTHIPVDNSTSVDLSHTPVSVACSATTPKGAYTAMMEMDRSGSMAGNDPTNVTLTAAKAFVGALGPGDEMAVGAFPLDAAQGRPYECTLYGPGFNADKTTWNSAIASLANPSGGTPLYKCAENAVGYVNSKAVNTNRALLLFTDGDDNASAPTTSADVISSALANNVKVFPIALSSQANILELGRIANATGGGVVLASDARQLLTAYGTLGKLLAGNTTTCRLTVKESIFGATYVTTGISSRPVRINVKGTLIEVPVTLPIAW